MRTGLQRVDPGRRALADYAAIAGEGQIERIRALGAGLGGARVVHISAAAPRGSVPDRLRPLLALAADAGLAVEWRVLFGDGSFASAMRDLYDGLQGAETAIDDDAWDAYLAGCASTGRDIPRDADVVVLHDPQTLGLLPTLAEAVPRRVWCCHVDASGAEGATWERLLPLLDHCDWGVFAADGFWPPNLGGDVRAIAPAIDPLAPKNMDMPLRLAGQVLRSLGLDLTRPIVCNVQRLDRWKDPHGMVDAFALAKETVPELQFVLVGALPGEGAADWRMVREVSDYAAGVDDVRVLSNYTGVGEAEVGALQRVARVQVQRSLREGFGLAASEALWKRTPVVGGTGGGLPEQVRDGRDGYLTDDVEQMARWVTEIVADPALAAELGNSGHERVGERFLVTRLLEDELGLLEAVLRGGRATVGP